MSKWIITIASLAALASVAAADSTVATVGSKSISMSELEKKLRPQLIEIDNSRFEALSEGLTEMVNQELIAQEAKARGVSVEDLEKAEITSKVKEPTEEDAKALFEQYKDKIQGTIDQVKPQLIGYLKQQQAETVREEFLATLRKKYPVKVVLEPPLVEVSSGGRPARGGKNAPITIISFSDYECPFCKRGEEVVEQVLKTYGDKISFVHRDFPLAFHARAKPAAEAAHCADAQGKFWEYHSKLFKTEDLSDASLKAIAKEVGLDEAKFDKCVASDQYAAAIDKDMEAGAEAGVNGTPAFFINGRMISGAQPFEEFKKIIDAELARKGA